LTSPGRAMRHVPLSLANRRASVSLGLSEVLLVLGAMVAAIGGCHA